MKSLINNDSQFLNIYYTNANDLKNKIHELELAAKLSDCKVLGVTETMFSDDIMDAEVSIANFKLFRIDRKTKGGRFMFICSRFYSMSRNHYKCP